MSVRLQNGHGKAVAIQKFKILLQLGQLAFLMLPDLDSTFPAAHFFKESNPAPRLIAAIIASGQNKAVKPSIMTPKIIPPTPEKNACETLRIRRTSSGGVVVIRLADLPAKSGGRVMP
jgi:hypothetical protein